MKREEKIRIADETFCEIFHDFNFFHFLNPTNQEEEKDRFFQAWEEGEVYHPQFTYDPLPATLDSHLNQLESLSLGDTHLEACYEKTRQELIQSIHALQSRGTPEITKFSNRLFGIPSTPLVEKAILLLKRRNTESKDAAPMMGVKGIQELFRERLREDRLEGWDVVEDRSNVDFVQIDWAHHKIRLQSGMIVSEKMARRILQHVIGAKIYRTVNGERQPFKCFALGFQGYLETDEGLAVELEEASGLLTPGISRAYAGRLIGAARSANASFFQVFKDLTSYFLPDQAYDIAVRNKRGLNDTSQPGGFLQDHLYLQGKEKIKLLSGPEKRLLYTGRIGIHHLPLVQELLTQKKLVDPAFVPSVFHGRNYT